MATLTSLCALAGCLALGAALASAAARHEFLLAPSERLSEGVPAEGPLGEPVPVPGPVFRLNTMVADSGKLYVAEEPSGGGYRLDKFDASTGAFVLQYPQVPSLSFLYSGLAVGHASGDVYVGGDEFSGGSSKGVVAVFSAAGSLLSTWKGASTPSFEGTKAFGCFECSGPGSVAVDNSSGLSWAAGDVYVTDREHRVVDVFKPEAGGGEEYITQLTGPEPPGALFAAPLSVAVNPTNDEVLVADRQANEDVVDIFEPAALAGQYEFAGTLTLPGGSFKRVRTVTVDGGNGDIYVAEDEGGSGSESIVYQFDSAGKFLGSLTGSPAARFSTVLSVAVDPVSHHVFVGDRHEDKNLGLVDVFGPNIVIPDVATEAASKVGTTSATLNGTVNLDKEGQATCQFDYGTSSEFGQPPALCPAPVTEEGSVAVHSELTGLQPDTTYHYRLQATNKNGTNPGEPLQNREFTTLGPGLHGESASAVGSASATLNATIDPRKSPTSYYFQYGTSTGYGSEAPVAPGASIGSGEGDVEVGRHLQGLLAGTVYHYRVVVVSEPKPGVVETFDEPDQTFTTQVVVSSTLPDGRQWELVSPPNKHGALIAGIGKDSTQASASGDAMTYAGNNPPEGNVQGYVLEAQIFSTRGPAGWSSQNITLPNAAATSVNDLREYRFFSEDLSLGVVERRVGEFTSLSPYVSPPDTERTPYLHHDFTCGATPAGCFEPLLTGASGYADVPPGTKFGEGEDSPAVEAIAGAPDLAHVILRTNVALTSTPTNGTSQLYEWSTGRPPAEALQPVSVLPDGKMSPRDTNAGTDGRYAGRHEISNDGTRVVWTDGGGGVSGHLYMRDMTKRETVTLDAVQSGAGEGEDLPLFQAASSDGSRVFFTDNRRLTKDSGQISGRPDLYECAIVEVAGKLHCELSDLTPVRAGEGTGVLLDPIIGVSEDGSWVYFVSNGVLAEYAIPGECRPEHSPPGATCNLYVWHNGVTKLVAVLSGQDNGDWAGKGNVHTALSPLTARVSPNGDWLTFMSQRGLTGYNTRDAVSGAPDEEVYLYNAETGKLVCASCNPTGARPNGVESRKMELGGISGNNGGSWEPQQWIAGSLPSWTEGTIVFGGAGFYQSRYLSDSGRLFFNSSDALVPQDSNGNLDVYQYEPAGVGGCSASSLTFSSGSGGCVDLISSGVADGESAFLDASENGNDVFFLTDQPLVPQDTDTALDVYDAHVCTAAVPCVSSPASPPPCVTADACRAAPSPQPSIFGAPASATFSGAGNVVSPASAPGATSKPLTRARKFSRAQKACRKQRNARTRAACERKARRQFGAGKSSKANAKRRSGR